MIKNFEKLKHTNIQTYKHTFSICLTETWCSNETIYHNSNLHLPQYNSIHLERKNKRGGGVCVFINKKLLFKHRKEFSVSEEANETLSIEILNKNSNNIIVSTCYRPPSTKITPLKKHITHVFNKLLKEKKKIFLSVILILTVLITQQIQK